MILRLIYFTGGALFGPVGAVIRFRWFEHSEIHWGIVALCAGVMGGLAGLFGRRFWHSAIGQWP
jgi:hypothetical protein